MLTEGNDPSETPIGIGFGGGKSADGMRRFCTETSGHRTAGWNHPEFCSAGLSADPATDPATDAATDAAAGALPQSSDRRAYGCALGRPTFCGDVQQ